MKIVSIRKRYSLLLTLILLSVLNIQAKNIDTTAVTREELKKAMYEFYMSKGPDPRNAPKPVMEVLSKTKEKDHERWHVRYLVDKKEYSFAYLLLPLSMQKNVKLPLVLCPHPTTDIGKDRVMAIYKDKAASIKDQTARDNRQYALDLVRRGFVVFAPDRAAYGERELLPDAKPKVQMSAFSEFLKKTYPKWNLNGKAIWDLQRALDFLVELDFVDKANIGIIGHSLGAWDAILLGGMDDRVKAAAMSSGGMVTYIPSVWTKDQTALRNFLKSEKMNLNSSANILLMLMAQRSVLYLYSLDDNLYRGRPQLLEAYKAVHSYYKKNNPGKTADINYFLHADGHDFTKPTRELTYKWLEERLNLNANK